MNLAILVNLENWVNLVNPVIRDKYGESGGTGHFDESGESCKSC